MQELKEILKGVASQGISMANAPRLVDVPVVFIVQGKPVVAKWLRQMRTTNNKVVSMVGLS